MIQITAGNKYMDIDAYASCLTYTKLLNSIGIEAIAVNTSNSINKSVPKSLLNTKYKFSSRLDNNNDFIILDVCNPNMIANEVLDGNIIEVIDHHPYYEFIDYWKERNANLVLDEIGSVCTIIYEKIKEKNKLEILDSDLCKLLIAGILDNTLNLNATITSKRDINAVNELIKLGKIDKNFGENYFIECQNSYKDNIIQCIEDDLKDNLNYPIIPKTFGQLLVANYSFVKEYEKEIVKYMNVKYNNWIINFIALNERKSYILTDSDTTAKSMNEILNGIIIDNNIIRLNKFKLRKELLKIFVKDC